MKVSEPAIHKLLHYIELIDAGCPIDRHELRDYEWIAIGHLKREREKIALEEAEEERERQKRNGKGRE